MLLMTLRDLQFRRRRILVVTMLTAVVFTLLFLMTGLIQRFNTEPFDAMRSIGANHWVVPEGISGPLTATSSAPASLLDAVAGADGAVIARGTMFAGDDQVEEILLVGLESERIEALELAEGSPPGSADAIVVDRLANVSVGDRVDVGDRSVTVAALTENTTVLAGLPMVVVELSVAQELAFGSTEVLTAALVNGDAPVAPDGFTVLTTDAVADDALGPLENAVSSIDLIRGLLWMVAAIIIGAVVYLSALERARDFAVLKAIGASTRSLGVGLAIQAALIALGASLIAIVLQFFVRPLFPLGVVMPPSAYWQIPLAAVVVALIAGIGGVRRVAASDPAQAFAGAA